jgi:hypothetical protein
MKIIISLYSILLLLLLAAAGCGSLNASAGRDAAETPTAARPAAPPVENANRAAAALNKHSFAPASGPHVAGNYELKTSKNGGAGWGNELAVEDIEDGTVKVYFSATSVYRANGAETFHEASGGGVLKLAGTTASGEIVEDGAENKCPLTIVFAAGLATLETASGCSFGVPIDGVYRKARSGPESAERATKAPVSVGFSGLEEFVNDFDKRRAGDKFTVDRVPLIERVERAGRETAFKGLYWLSADGDLNVATSFYAPAELVNELRPRLETDAAHLTVECVLIEVSGAGEVYRSPYAVRIEAVDAAGQTLWTISGPPPKRFKIQY